MAISKLILNGEVQMDVTSDTVTAGSMLSGTTATKNDGTKATGTIASKSSSNLTVSGATVTAPAGYYSANASKSVATMTLPTTTSTSATSGYTLKATLDRSTSDRYLNIAPGYNSAGGYYKINKVANGSVTAPSSISGTSATVSTGTNTLTLTKTVSVTPNVTTAGYVSSGTAGNSSVSLTANVTTKAAATITPSTSAQEIAAGTYLTGTQTISAMPSGTAGTPTATKGTVSNHAISVTPSVTNTTGYITGGTKTGTAVSVSASELVSGTKSIIENGTGIDVTNYASVDVDVPSSAETYTINLDTMPNNRDKAYVADSADYATSTKYTSSNTSFSLPAGTQFEVYVSSSASVTNYVYYNNEVVASPTYSAYYTLTMPKYDIEVNVSGDDTSGRSMYVSTPMLTINKNGYHNVENYGFVNVQAAPTYTATFITTSGASDQNYVSYTDASGLTTKYYSVGSTFTFSAGDTATFVGTYGGACKRYLNGELISTDTNYVYTLPACNIEIQLQNYSSPFDQYAIQKITTSDGIDALTITQNGTYTASGSTRGYSPVTVNVSGGGGGSCASKKQINFIDYDGTIVESYTATEWQSVTVLPSNPSHTGLTAQGWNWTKAQIDAQLTAVPNGDVWVGQMYITTSGDTEIDVRFADSARLSPYFSYAVNGTIIIDWGDNSISTVTGTSLTTRIFRQHVYASTGDYTITIHVESGSWAFFGTATYALLNKNTSTASANRTYSNCVQNVRIGADTSIGDYAFSNCYSLASVTIPSDVTSIGIHAFQACYSLASVTIPSDVTSISTYAFNSCYSLTSVTIPSGVTSIDTYAFSGCYILASLTIPSGVTSISTYALSNCYSLASIAIPSGVTSIGNSAFNGCYSLASLTIPSDVTSIGNSAFSSCYGMAEYHIKPTTVPALGTTAFNNIQSDCKIYVPSASLTTYQGATNWSTYASYMQGE